MPSDKTFVRISELAKMGSVLSSTIRHYTDLGLLKPALDTEGGHRLYDPEDSLKKLRLIQILSRRGKTLPEIKTDILARQSMIKILIVDDDEEVASFLKDLFSTLGQGRAEIGIAKDGFSAGKMCVEMLPDLLVLDLMLPGVNGIEVCRQLRQDPDMADVKILAISGYGTAENAKAVMSAGANAFLAKPFGLSEFKEKLKVLGVWD